MLSGLRPNANSPEEIKVYEEFCRNFEAGRKYIAIALGIDERNKGEDSKCDFANRMILQLVNRRS